ncbi:DUF3103 family protein [Shewanella surugensis]|uniref:DUF3103 domain-containing protein n=1 Tax=Shewanella surugensis TaxID=212020 RepID=A0ABT0LGW7_9GAMM|nr:DUF3103 family protein [Shewanella surugensis]MCL1126610.1 DUF3103 domain-containing protein [Shewanella surugensis]
MKLIPTLTLTLASIGFFSTPFQFVVAEESKELLLNQASAETLSTSVAHKKRSITQELAVNYKTYGHHLKTQVNQYQLSVNLEKFIYLDKQTDSNIRKLNQGIRQLKGITQHNTNIIDLRLANANMLTQWQAGQSPLFAYAPEGNDTQWTYIEAFDEAGNIHLLDAHVLPTRPVFIIELNGEQTLKEGIETMHSVFNAANVNLDKNILRTDFSTMVDEPLSTTVVKNIKLKNVEESWISGDAEVYAIVSGISPENTDIAPQLDILEFPYLDEADTNYSPNQIVVQWENYRWQAVDIVLMENDDNTNYKNLASAILEAATAVLRLIPDPTVQGYAIIPQLTNAIIQAMPDSWWTNDDDYLDVFYTIFENQTYTNHKGASNNATVDLEPLTIQPRG